MIPKAPAHAKGLTQLLNQAGPNAARVRARVAARVSGVSSVGGFEEGPMGKTPLSKLLKQKQISGSLHKSIRELLAKGLIERTISDKPQSRLQQYRLTEAGTKAVKMKRE